MRKKFFVYTKGSSRRRKILMAEDQPPDVEKIEEETTLHGNVGESEGNAVLAEVVETTVGLRESEGMAVESDQMETTVWVDDRQGTAVLPSLVERTVGVGKCEGTAVESDVVDKKVGVDDGELSAMASSTVEITTADAEGGGTVVVPSSLDRTVGEVEGEGTAIDDAVGEMTVAVPIGDGTAIEADVVEQTVGVGAGQGMADKCNDEDGMTVRVGRAIGTVIEQTVEKMGRASSLTATEAAAVETTADVAWTAVGAAEGQLGIEDGNSSFTGAHSLPRRGSDEEAEVDNEEEETEGNIMGMEHNCGNEDEKAVGDAEAHLQQQEDQGDDDRGNESRRIRSEGEMGADEDLQPIADRGEYSREKVIS